MHRGQFDASIFHGGMLKSPLSWLYRDCYLHLLIRNVNALSPCMHFNLSLDLVLHAVDLAEILNLFIAEI